jgi:hypothetical protein
MFRYKSHFGYITENMSLICNKMLLAYDIPISYVLLPSFLDPNLQKIPIFGDFTQIISQVFHVISSLNNYELRI